MDRLPKRGSYGKRTRTPASTAKALKNRGDTGWCVNLYDSVQITNIDPQFERAGGHNDAVGCARKSFFGTTPLIGAKRAVGHKLANSLASE
jgi:hypothetical protein